MIFVWIGLTIILVLPAIGLSDVQTEEYERGDGAYKGELK